MNRIFYYDRMTSEKKRSDTSTRYEHVPKTVQVVEKDFLKFGFYQTTHILPDQVERERRLWIDKRSGICV